MIRHLNKLMRILRKDYHNEAIDIGSSSCFRDSVSRRVVLLSLIVAMTHSKCVSLTNTKGVDGPNIYFLQAGEPSLGEDLPDVAKASSLTTMFSAKRSAKRAVYFSE